MLYNQNMNPHPQPAVKTKFKQLKIFVADIKKVTETRIRELNQFYMKGITLHGKIGEEFREKFEDEYKNALNEFEGALTKLNLIDFAGKTDEQDMESVLQYGNDIIDQLRESRQSINPMINEMRGFVFRKEHLYDTVESLKEHRRLFQSLIAQLKAAQEDDVFPNDIKVRMADVADSLQSAILRIPDNATLYNANEADINEYQSVLIGGQEDYDDANSLLNERYKFWDAKIMREKAAKEQKLADLQAEIKHLAVDIIAQKRSSEEEGEGLSPAVVLDYANEAYSLGEQLEAYDSEYSFEEILSQTEQIAQVLRKDLER